MDNQVRDELVLEAASKIHEAWCEGEMRAFYKRFYEVYKTGSTIGDALRQACFKNGIKRNESKLVDFEYVLGHTVMIDEAFRSYEGFKRMLELEYYELKRFVSRELTKEEQEKAREDYNSQTKEENILRDFRLLSADSQRENLEAARSAFITYVEFAKRGVTMEQFESEEAKRAIGTLIHAEWMKRNKKTKANKHLFVPYEKLDDWTKQQDIDVFMAMLDIIKKDPEKYAVEVDLTLPKLRIKEMEQLALEIASGKKKC